MANSETFITTQNTLSSLANSEWTYSHSITGLKVCDVLGADGNTYPNTVIQTYWKYSAVTPANQTGTFTGATPFNLDTQSNNFIFTNFNQLEESNVLNWIINSINGSYADHINEKINEQINNQIIIISEPLLPWANNINI
jgi:hypothetical protein